jgi:hypothetical protein
MHSPTVKIIDKLFVADHYNKFTHECVTILKHVLMKHKHEVQRHITKLAPTSPGLPITNDTEFTFTGAQQPRRRCKAFLLLKEWGITECANLKYGPN